MDLSCSLFQYTAYNKCSINICRRIKAFRKKKVTIFKVHFWFCLFSLVWGHLYQCGIAHSLVKGIDLVPSGIMCSEWCDVGGTSGMLLFSGDFHSGLCSYRCLRHSDFFFFFFRHSDLIRHYIYIRRVFICTRLIA